MVTPAAVVYSSIASTRGCRPGRPRPVIAGVVALATPTATLESDALSEPESSATVTVVTDAAKLAAVIRP